MKITLTNTMFKDQFKAIRPDNFSNEALDIIFDYMEEMEQDTGEEAELDVVGICCEVSESSFEDILNDYSTGIDLDGLDEEEVKGAVEEWLEENTTVIGTTGNTMVFVAF